MDVASLLRMDAAETRGWRVGVEEGVVFTERVDYLSGVKRSELSRQQEPWCSARCGEEVDVA